jgi:hypothetical protein
LCADVGGSDLLNLKTSIPADLRTAQWSRLPTWLRERAFFMASVNRSEVLDAFRETVSRYVKGEIGRTQAREILDGHLARLNYKPLPGQEGTIKDLGSVDRQNVVLDTNLEQVNGWARWARQQNTLAAYPAQRLVRFRRVKKPRNWQARWIEARARTTAEGCSDEHSMIALVNHPIWVALSRFGNPYPPFDFNSGMGIIPVVRSQSDELGLLPEADSSTEHKEMMKPQDKALNDSLQADPTIHSQKIREELSHTLKGFARWEAGSLLFTDPNGTRKTSVEELRQIWEEGLPDGFPLLQRDALRDYLRDPEDFSQKTDRDAWEDYQRLLRRLGLREIPESLWRGLAFFHAQEEVAP